MVTNYLSTMETLLKQAFHGRQELQRPKLVTQFLYHNLLFLKYVCLLKILFRGRLEVFAAKTLTSHLKEHPRKEQIICS